MDEIHVLSIEIVDYIILHIRSDYIQRSVSLIVKELIIYRE